MTGLMIMLPVLFQLQITPNSVITGLCCQPSSGPLTVCWPGAVFSPLQSAWTWRGVGGTQKPRDLKKKKKTATASDGLLIAHAEPMCPQLIVTFLFKPSVTEVLSRQVIITISTSTTGQMTLEPGPIVLTWSSFIALLRLTRSFFTSTSCLMPGFLWQSRQNKHVELASTRSKKLVFTSVRGLHDYSWCIPIEKLYMEIRV